MSIAAYTDHKWILSQYQYLRDDQCLDLSLSQIIFETKFVKNIESADAMCAMHTLHTRECDRYTVVISGNHLECVCCSNCILDSCSNVMPGSVGENVTKAWSRTMFPIAEICSEYNNTNDNTVYIH